MTHGNTPFMKKLALLLAAVLICAAFGATAEAINEDDFDYSLLEDGTAEIYRYSGNAKELTIPEMLDGHIVTCIGEQAFRWCDSFASVTIPNSVTTIGDMAFYGCRSLTGVTIADSVSVIGHNPFLECFQLTEIRVSKDHPALIVENGVLFSRQDKRLVCYPRKLSNTSYAIPKGTLMIGDAAFSQCVRLKQISIPASITAIGDFAFYHCSGLEGVSIPDSVTYIGKDAFSHCHELILTVPSGSYAEQYCIENGLDYTLNPAI